MLEILVVFRPASKYFFGVRYKKNYEINNARNYILIGTMQVKIKDDAPS
jgi:hypothetical protein